MIRFDRYKNLRKHEVHARVCVEKLLTNAKVYACTREASNCPDKNVRPIIVRTNICVREKWPLYYHPPPTVSLSLPRGKKNLKKLDIRARVFREVYRVLRHTGNAKT